MSQGARESAVGRRWVVGASVILVLLYGVNALGAYVPALSEVTAQITNVEGQAKEGGIEIIEALLWAYACVAFGWLTLRTFKATRDLPLTQRLRGPLLWSAFFALLAFMALGEETSWGQVYGIYAAPEAVASVNAQEEFNLHNLDVAEIIGLEADHPLVPYLKNLSHVINPIFYAFFLTVWVLIPGAMRRGKLQGGLWRGYPLPSVAVSRFFAANVVAWLAVDRLLFDVGELFELSISLTIAMVAREAFHRGPIPVADQGETPGEGADPLKQRRAENLDDFHPVLNETTVASKGSSA